MAVKFAIATGLWSNPAIWDNGTVPLTGDDVYANGFTVTIDQNIDVAGIRNTSGPKAYATIATPIMTSNVTPSGVSNANGTAINAWLAFDQDLNTAWFTSGTSGWLAYQFPSAKIITAYAFRTSSNNNPAVWTFQGSNDGVTWTTLDSRSLSTPLNAWTAFTIPNITAYLYYRLNVSSLVSGGNITIGELQMTELVSPVFGGTAGGGFVLLDGYSVTSAASLTVLQGTLLTYTGSVSATITCPGVTIVSGNAVSSPTTIIHSGTGTLTINGNLNGIATNQSSGGTHQLVNLTSTGSLVVNGNVVGFSNNTTNGFLLYCINGQNGNNITVNGNVGYLGATSTSTGGITAVCILSANGIVSVTGALTGMNYTGGASNAQVNCIRATNSTVTIIGSITGNNASSAATIVGNHALVYTIGGGTLNITGNITGGTGNANVNVGVRANSNLNITGNLLGGAAASAVFIEGAYTTTINGNVTAGGGSAAHGLYITGAPTATVTGTITGSAAAPGIFSSNISTTLNCTGPFINNANGMMAAWVTKMFLTSTPTYWGITNGVGANRYLYTADYAPDYPMQSDVRLGVSYNGGLMTGTMNVPNPGLVTFGTPVGTTTGTALFDAPSIIAAVWNTQTTGLTTSGSIGVRAKNSLTADTLGNLLASF